MPVMIKLNISSNLRANFRLFVPSPILMIFRSFHSSMLDVYKNAFWRGVSGCFTFRAIDLDELKLIFDSDAFRL